MLDLRLPRLPASSNLSRPIRPPVRTNPTVPTNQDTAAPVTAGMAEAREADMAAADTVRTVPAGPITVVATVAAGLIAAIMLAPAAVRIVVQAVAVTVATMVILAVAAGAITGVAVLTRPTPPVVAPDMPAAPDLPVTEAEIEAADRESRAGTAIRRRAKAEREAAEKAAKN